MKEAQHFFGTLRAVATALFLCSTSLQHYGVSAVGCGVCIFGSCTWSCDQSNCNNHATTINCGSLFSQCSPCTCDPAWYGSACQTASTPCASYCNGRAIGASGYLETQGCTCTCDPAWYGSTCQTASTPCASYCNGRAIGASGYFETQGCTCTCAPAYYGTTCASLATLCSIPTNCDVRGTSVVSGFVETNGCTCECKPGWHNKLCSCPILQCSTTPGATAGSFLTFPLCYCACSLGYSGATCSRRDTISKDSISMSVTKMLSLSFSSSADKGTRSASLSVSIALTKSGSPSAQFASRSLTFTDVASSSALLSVSMLTMTHNHSESLSISVASASHENSISHSPSFSVHPTVTTSSSVSISVSRSATFTVSASTSTMFSTTESQSREASASATTTTTISDSSTKSISRSRPSHTRSMSASPSETSSASHSSTTSFSESSSSSTTESDTFTPPLPITLTASCPTTARLTVSTQLTDLWLMRNPSSVNLSTRCALKTSAEAILSNSSELPCIPVFAIVEGGRIALPSTRGPAPPFLVAVPYELDGNWIVRLPSFPTSAETTRENASTFLIRDNVSMITVQFDNHTNLTTASGTLFVLIPSVPEWQSKLVVLLETACGKHVVDYGTTPNDDGLYITVTWPQKQFGTLDQVAVGLVTAGSTLSGNPTAAAALAMVGLLSCSGSTPALQSAGYFVSLFFSLGPAAVGMGNLGIIFTISSLHFLVVKAWMHFHRERNLDESMSDMRFPAWSIFIAMYLLQLCMAV
ncbi:GPI-anchored surface protein, putative [Bodo saltans]|uniref:GPI-anchored surface protein, putative n=1 Tax=Bodo saltans TaxID=75058 RepID=A0A0S4JP26_BODSA|nr:GPI-anchored surface protein, putative [Bodo saltans]|eukprot:CUG93310.1 GPI-anchored surface protein, putative [Bodo saltans]